MADEKLTAATRIEKLLDNIAGGDNEVTPATRLEKFLSYIADAMEGGGGSGGGCECKQLIITVTGTDENPVLTPNLSYNEMSDITGGLLKVEHDLFYTLGYWKNKTTFYELYFIMRNPDNTVQMLLFHYNSDGTITKPVE